MWEQFLFRKMFIDSIMKSMNLTKATIPCLPYGDFFNFLKSRLTKLHL